MSLRFSANLPSLLRSVQLPTDRFGQAIKFGFQAVELWENYDLPVENLVDAKKNLNIVLMGAYSGSGNRGLAATPGKEAEFKECLEVSITYAKALKCSRIHVMSGLRMQDVSFAQQEETYIENLTFAASRLAEDNITAVIEAINSSVSVPGYFMNSPQRALEVVKRVNHPNLRLLLDIYHVQMCEGNLTQFIKESLPYAGHIQISQAPNRSNPHLLGEINYPYILKLIADLGYTGWVGLEYFPNEPIEDCIQWLHSLGHTI